MKIDLKKITFREKTTDENIFKNVFHLNEYNLSQLEDDDVVVDIGSHIGSFSLKAYEMGSRKIFAFEANYDNSIICAKNCLEYDIRVFNNAVRGNYNLKKVGSRAGKNLDSENMNMGGLAISIGDSIDVISLEDILNMVGGKIKILKLDCEGSEYPIIFESEDQVFENIEIIIGEFHPGSLPINKCEKYENSPKNLEKRLQYLNYYTNFISGSVEDYGHFYCKKIK